MSVIVSKQPGDNKLVVVILADKNSERYNAMKKELDLHKVRSQCVVRANAEKCLPR